MDDTQPGTQPSRQHPAPTRTRIRARLVASAVLIGLTAVTVAACSGSSGGGATASMDSGAAVSDSMGAPDLGAPDLGAPDLATGDLGVAQEASKAETPGPAIPTEPQVISTGNVELRADDVAAARTDVTKVVARYQGKVAQDSTETDDDGKPRSASLLVRVPTEHFADAMADLAEVGELVRSDSRTEDVTTQVIDVEVRLEVQRRSIARVSALLDRAESIRDIITIESELAQRQANLEELERQQEWLADQTSMSTITVWVERTKQATREGNTGFVAGLKAGWDGLVTVTIGLTTAAGVVLPFLVVLLVLVPLAWPVVRLVRRRIRARRTARTPSDA